MTAPHLLLGKESLAIYFGASQFRRNRIFNLRNRSALAVNCCVIIHCLEVSCKEDQIYTNSELLHNNSRTRAGYFDSNTK